MKLTGYRFFLGLTLAYAILIFYLSSISDLDLPRSNLRWIEAIIHDLIRSDYAFFLAPLIPLFVQQDKLLHVILFFGFGLLINLTLRSKGKTVLNAFVLSIILGSLYAASDEIHQIFVPRRTASVLDLTADITGILLAQLFILFFYITKYIYLKYFRDRGSGTF